MLIALLNLTEFNLTEFFLRCWMTLCELAPWLLLGMLVSGLLHVLLPKQFVRRRFQGLRGVVHAVVLGVPLPLCSCGVIPAGIGLKNDGASDGAAIGFLVSTPQTGVDSILVSASFFGWPFAIFKMVVAAVTGILSGWITDATSQKLTFDERSTAIATAEPELGSRPRWSELIPHSIEILNSIWLWLVVGIAVSALIELLGFETFVSKVNEAGLLPAMLLMLAISIPLYVCATASVPIAAAFVQSGFPPAVALVFLMAGPATNLTTMGAIRSRFGWRVLVIYLTTLVLGSFAAAFLFDWLLIANVGSGDQHQHDHQSWWAIASGLIILALIIRVGFVTLKRRFIGGPRIGQHSSVISVAGMHCGSCVNRIETAVRTMEGVDSVFASLEHDTVTVAGAADPVEVAALIQSLGFQINGEKTE